MWSGNLIIVVGDFNISLLIMGSRTRQNNKEKEDSI